LYIFVAILFSDHSDRHKYLADPVEVSDAPGSQRRITQLLDRLASGLIDLNHQFLCCSWFHAFSPLASD
jgi:hypothetical protein